MFRFFTRGMKTSEFWGLAAGWVASLVTYILANDGTISGYAAQVVKDHAPTALAVLPSLWGAYRTLLKMVESWAASKAFVAPLPDMGGMPDMSALPPVTPAPATDAPAA